MFNNAMGLILADNKKISLGELSNPRALSAMPFGGRYRIIDFMLSNMVNTGIKNIGLLTYNKYKSLMDHTGTGGAWSLDRKNDGLHILPPYVNSEATGINSDEELTGIMDFLRQSRTTYIIVTGCNIIHGSDSVESAKREIGIFFPEGIVTYDRTLDKWTYE